MELPFRLLLEVRKQLLDSPQANKEQVSPFIRNLVAPINKIKRTI